MSALFPSRFSQPFRSARANDTGDPINPFTARFAALLTLLAGLLLLVDQQLETKFIASPVVHIDESSMQITTESVSFLPDFKNVTHPNMQEGHLLILEVSPITKTVVAYKEADELLVQIPREIIFNYWPLTLAMTLLSLFLLIRWNHLKSHTELLVLNLVLMLIVSILYVISH